MNNGLLIAPSTVSSVVDSKLSRALKLLVEARGYAEDLETTPWDFGVPVGELRGAGLSDNDLRWLVAKGYMEQAVELTGRGEPRRTFRPAVGALLSRRACFCLTESGQAYARRLLGGTESRNDLCNGHERADLFAGRPFVNGDVLKPVIALPSWDRDRQELTWRGLIIKQFKVPSPNQETILAAFEEDRWPARIDDPLPPQADQPPKRRLHDTINALNRNQKNALIRFLGDGSGLGVRWEPSIRGVVPEGNGYSDRLGGH